MKKRAPWFMPVVILAVLAALGVIVFGIVRFMMGQSDIEVASTDVIRVVKLCVPYIAALVVLIVVVCIVCAILQNKNRAARFMVYAQSAAVLVLGAIVVVNSICFGPVYSLLGNVLADKVSLSKETSETGTQLISDIADEGIVLLENDGFLPLSSENQKINIFGWSSVNPTTGGVGSGASNSDTVVGLIDGLEKAGYEVNSEIEQFYRDYRDPAEAPSITLASQDWTIVQPTMEEYDAANIFEDAKDFSDTALIVIARNGGENADLPTSITDENTMETGKYGSMHVYTTNADDVNPEKSYLDISNREEAMIQRVTSEFKNVIVLINANNAMNLGWVRDYDNIKAVVQMAGGGEQGFASLGRILNGEVNPSGKLADTYVYNNLNAPYANNLGDMRYDNMDDVVSVLGEGHMGMPYVSFVNYVEGIYVGYRWYETAFAENAIDYDKTVLYPFGYGMSYTTFEEKITDLQDDGTNITVNVEVKNTGDVAGKEVVELYYTPPYTNGGIEKAAVNLAAFDKTDLLQPGESQTVTVTFRYEDMASYDYTGIKAKDGAYVLEAGDYDISLRSDAHTVVDSHKVHVDEDIIYNDENDGARQSDLETAKNQFDFAEGYVTYLSRKDQFANYEEATAAPATYTMPEDQVETFMFTGNYNVEEHNNKDDEMPATGVDNGLTIQDMIGLDFNDPKWDELLDQLTVDEMASMVAYGGYGNSALESINLKATSETEGVSGISSIYNNNGGNALPVSTMTASTWNCDLAQRRGELLGKTASELRITGVYCPSMNTHRTAFDGRNFEYYSEDGTLAGKIAASEITGAKEYGLLTYIKHFALNDQETNRNNMLCTWSNEQAIREIYLKPFEVAVKEGEALGCMSSFNYIGTRFAGACNELQTNVMRNEWGFHGAIVTDWFADYGYMVSDDIIRNGGDKMLTVGSDAGELADKTSATAVKEMRRATHDILYALANSNAMDASNYQRAGWEKMFIGVDVALIVLLVLTEGFIVYHYLSLKKKQKNEKAEEK